MKKLFFLLFVLFQSVLFSQNFPNSNDFNISPRYIDIDTIRLDVSIDPYQGSITGKSEISFVKLRSKVDSFFIHGVNMELASLKLNSNEVKYKHIKKGGFWIYPDSISDKNSLIIEYSAQPKKGMYFIAWNDEHGKREKQIWTQGQGIDNRHWFPSYDLQHEKSIFDIKIEFPSGYKILSNGKLLSKKDNTNSISWHYQTLKPMSSYLLMIAGGEYNFESENITINSANIEFQYWHYLNRKSWNEATYYKTEEIMAFLLDEIGVEYPWAKYAQIPVSDFKHGAMENTGATIFTQSYNCNDSSFVDVNYFDVNAHEMAHQWFGNSLTAESSKHHWLQEGFATYFQLKAIEKFIGEDKFIWEKRNRLNEIFAASKSNPLPVLDPKAGTEKFYHKGAFILMMLDDKLGHDNFKKALKDYVAKYSFEVVRTEQLIRSFEESTGVPLNKYFDQWLSNKVEAEVTVSHKNIEGKNIIIFERTNEIWDEESKEFVLEIPLVIHYSKKQREELNFVLSSKSDTLEIDDKILTFEVDPKISSIANYNVDKTQELWEQQLRLSKSSYSRYRSALALKNKESKSKIKLYSKLDLNKENFNVLFEIFNQIDSLGDKKSLKLKHRILEKRDSDLRKLLIQYNTKIDENERELYEDFLNTKSYDLIATSLDKLCLSFPEKADVYLDRFKATYGAQVPIVRMSYLANSISHSKKHSPFEKEIMGEELVSYTSSSHDFLTRIYASFYVFNCQHISYDFIRNIIDGSVHFNYQLTSHCREILEALNEYDVFNKELKRIREEDNLSEKEIKYLDKLIGDNNEVK